MFETETVTTRPPACGVADIFPAESISAMIQPPKMSPLGLQSAGIASVRDANSPLGSVEFRRLSLERIPASPGRGYRIAGSRWYDHIPHHVAMQHDFVNSLERVWLFCAASHIKKAIKRRLAYPFR